MEQAKEEGVCQEEEVRVVGGWGFGSQSSASMRITGGKDGICAGNVIDSTREGGKELPCEE